MVSDWHWIVLLTLCLLHVSNGHWAAQCWNSMTRRHPHEGCQKAPRGTLTVGLGDSGIYRPVRRREWLLQIMWPPAGRWSGISGFGVKSHPSTRETDAPLNSLGHVTLRESGKADKTRPQRKPRYIRHILFPFSSLWLWFKVSNANSFIPSFSHYLHLCLHKSFVFISLLSLIKSSPVAAACNVTAFVGW